MEFQNKQASRPLHVQTTTQPPSKITEYKCTHLNTYLWNQNQKSGIGHQILINENQKITLCGRALSDPSRALVSLLNFISFTV